MTDPNETELFALLDQWRVEAPNTDLWPQLATTLLQETPEPLAEILSELKALQREVSALRGEVSALRRERGGSAYPTLMPYTRADDKPLPLA